MSPAAVLGLSVNGRGRNAFFLLVLTVVAAVGARNFVKFTPDFDSTVGETTDGFKVQVAHVLGLYDIGALFDLILHDGLLLIHAIRVLTITPFLIIENYLGTTVSFIALILTIIPLVTAIPKRIHPVIAAVPLLLPLFVSGRAVLVAVGLGYIILFLLQRRIGWILLLFAVGCVNLSSASVLSSVLLLIFWVRPNSKLSRHIVARFVTILILGVSLYLSFQEKRYGFTIGSAGYEAYAFQGSNNIILSAISRATILISFMEGRYIRGVLYLLVGLFLVYKLVTLTFNRDARHIQIMLLCCVPGLLLEGLGVIAVFFPAFWLVIGALTSPKPATPPNQNQGASGALRSPRRSYE